MTAIAEGPVSNQDEELTRRALRHALDKTTDMADRELRVPLHYYRDPKITEIEESQILRRVPLAIVPSAQLPEKNDYVVRSVLAETKHSQFVVAEVRAAVTASAKQRSRLALWSRRLLGEAITQAQYVLAERDELVDLVVSGTDGLGRMTEFFDRLQRTHAERMAELGLG